MSAAILQTLLSGHSTYWVHLHVWYVVAKGMFIGACMEAAAVLAAFSVACTGFCKKGL